MYLDHLHLSLKSSIFFSFVFSSFIFTVFSPSFLWAIWIILVHQFLWVSNVLSISISPVFKKKKTNRVALGTALYIHLTYHSLLMLSYYHFKVGRGATGKEPACEGRRCKRCRFDPWVGKIPWRKAWQPTPVFMPGESHGQRSLAGYSP